MSLPSFSWNGDICKQGSLAGGVEKGRFFQPLSFVLWVATFGTPFSGPRNQ